MRNMRLEANGGAAPAALAAWYAATLASEKTQKVVNGESSAGPFSQYFMADE